MNSWVRTSGLLLVIASLLYGGFVFWTLPGVVVVWNDDFGYLRSVVATLQHGRPWTDDWLEPWAASFSLLSAGVYLVTRNFLVATYGLLALLAATAFAGLCLLAWERRLTRVTTALIALVVLTFPTLIWKELEFTGVALHLPCLLFALWTAARRRWLAFSLIWGVAIANRQSALLWGVLPGLEFLAALWSKSRRQQKEWQKPMLAVVAGCAVYLVFLRCMNATHAQRLVTGHVWESFDRSRALRYLPIAASVFYVAGGVIRLAGTRAAAAGSNRYGWQWVVRGVTVLTGFWLFRADFMDSLSFEHPGFHDRQLIWFVRLLIGAAMVGWWRRGFEFDGRAAACAVAAFGFVMLRADLWDYYLLDVCCFGLASLAVTPAGQLTESRGESTWLVRRSEAAALAALLGLLVFNFRGLQRIKVEIDWQAARVQLAERALRARKIGVGEIGFTNVGFMGWHLNPYFVAHDAAVDRRQIGFVRYLEGNRSVQDEISPLVSGRLKEKKVSESAGIEEDWFSELWLYHRYHRLSSAPLPPPTLPAALEAGGYVPQRFPLTSNEWTDLIHRRLK